MNSEDVQAFRRRRLADALTRKFDGNKARLGVALGYKDGAFIRQMLSGLRPITEKRVAALEALPGMTNWFADSVPDPRATLVVADMLQKAPREDRDIWFATMLRDIHRNPDAYTPEDRARFEAALVALNQGSSGGALN